MSTRIILLILACICSVAVFAQDNITAMEYYIDTDPGVGDGVQIPVSSALDQDVNFTVATGSLAHGFHELVIRSQDASGDWGIQRSSTFYVSEFSVEAGSEVAMLEYYFDTDPGVGAATAIDVTDATAIDLNQMVVSSSLDAGFHTQVFRARDDDNNWGIQHSRSFYVHGFDVATQGEVVMLEYFFDTDPGIGNGTAIDITDATTIDVDQLVASSSLSSGFHTVNIRVQDSDGLWSHPKTVSFFIGEPSSSDSNRALVSIEYFLDTDPGFGLATGVDISPSQPTIDEDLTIATNTLPNGDYSIGVRVEDEQGSFSITSTAPFTICNTPTVAFTASTVCVGTATQFTNSSTIETGDVFSWDFDNDGNEDSNVVGDVSFTYPAAGTYTAALTIDRNGCTATTSIEVSVESIPNANAGTDQAITSNQTELAATPANTGETGVWSVLSGTGTIADANDPTSAVTDIGAGTLELRWTVTNDLGGCTDEDEVIITYTPLSTETDILTFTLASFTGPAVINAVDHTVTGEVSNGTDLSTLVPTLTVSSGATVSPQSGVAQSFVAPVTYTVTAEDGATTQDWTVKITEAPSSQTDILTFTLVELLGNADINATDHTVTAEVASGTDLTELAPVIAVSEGATISPLSGSLQSFTSPVVYTVTAEDGITMQDWTVTLTEGPSTETDILTFVLQNEASPAVVNVDLHTVVAVVENGSGVTGLIPSITVSEGATISPLSGVSQTFTEPVTYTVTAEDGVTTQAWVVTVTEALSNETDILTFTLSDQTGAPLIDATAHTVVGEVSSGTSLLSLDPTITLSEGATISPTGPQDFSNPVVYSVIAEDEVTIQNWTVTITQAPLGLSVLEGIQVYPNPAKDLVMLEGVPPNSSVRLVDIFGRSMHTEFEGDRISLRSLHDGIYFILIEDLEGDRLSIRIQKKN